ncbi:M24 family metallopeptidase [Candidatus Omnitrophota bacterium]
MNIRAKEIQEGVAIATSFDVFLVTKPENIYYISHFPGDDSLLLLTPKKFYFITDKRYSDDAESFFASNKLFQVLVAKKNINKFALCQKIVKKYSFRKIGFEARGLSYASAVVMGEKLGRLRLVPIDAFIEQFRLIKTPSELDLIKRAINCNEEAYKYLKRILSASKTELAIRYAVEAQMRKVGSDGPSFPTIIAAGKKSACPHARSDTTKIGHNRIVLADMGTQFRHYCSDLTRTFYLGRMSRFFRRVYDNTLMAQEIAISSIKPGVVIKDVVAAVRNYFKKAGCLQYFTHSLGHGVGLEVHERPHLSDGNTEVFQEGMVVTIEPGLYYPGRGGVRIEDMIVVTRSGVKVLSQYPKSLDKMQLYN